MRKVFFGWKADKDKVENGTLTVMKNEVTKIIEDESSHLRSAGIYIHNETYVCFDDSIDNVEFLFNNSDLPDWVEPLVLDEREADRIPNKFMDIYTMECVRDLIYWWFEVYCKKTLSKEKKNRIAKLVGLNFNKKRYSKFIEYGFNHPEYVKYNTKQVEDRKRRNDRSRI